MKLNLSNLIIKSAPEEYRLCVKRDGKTENRILYLPSIFGFMLESFYVQTYQSGRCRSRKALFDRLLMGDEWSSEFFWSTWDRQPYRYVKGFACCPDNDLCLFSVPDCSSSSVKRDIADDKMRQCSPLRKMSCIPKNLYCDGTINCGFDEDFAADELECSSETVRSTDFKRSISLYVFAVSAVSTLAIVIMFVLLVCCCMRKFQKPPRPANEPRRSPLDIEFHLNTSGYAKKLFFFSM